MMVDFIGGEPISVGVDEPITFENKTNTAFDVSCGIVFRKSGVYRVSVDGKRTSVEIEPERKTGKWIKVSPAGIYECSECGQIVITQDIDAYRYCHGCGADLREEGNN